MTYNFLSSPYTHNDPVIMEERYELACSALAWLLDRKLWTYSPIVHCHEVAKKRNLPRHSSFWASYNRAMLKDAAGMFVLTIDGWDKSVGVTEEIKWATRQRTMIKYLHPNGGEFIIRSSP